MVREVLQEEFAYVTDIPRRWFRYIARFANNFRGANGCRVEWDAHGPVVRLGDDVFQFRDVYLVRPVIEEGALTQLVFERARVLCSIPETVDSVRVEECAPAGET